MFLELFVIGRTLALTTMGIRFRVSRIFHEGNACADKLANLGFTHREYFH